MVLCPNTLPNRYPPTGFLVAAMSLKPTSPNVSTIPNCPICGWSSQEAWRKNEFPLFQCDACSHLFCQIPSSENYVAENYSDDYFEDGEGGYSNYLENSKNLLSQGKSYGKILGRHATAGRVLDIGSAAGFILKGLVDAGWQGRGVEPNLRMAKHAATQLGLEVTNQSIEDFESSEAFDAVTLVQVISHLRDPCAILKKVNQLLRPDGLLLIETWNRKSLTARCFGRYWHQYNPPSVIHWFGNIELNQILAQNGFKVVGQGRPIKWVSAGNGVALAKHSARESKLASLALLPLGLIPSSLKFPYFLDDVFWVLAKKVEPNNESTT